MFSENISKLVIYIYIYIYISPFICKIIFTIIFPLYNPFIKCLAEKLIQTRFTLKSKPLLTYLLLFLCLVASPFFWNIIIFLLLNVYLMYTHQIYPILFILCVPINFLCFLGNVKEDCHLFGLY